MVAFQVDHSTFEAREKFPSDVRSFYKYIRSYGKNAKLMGIVDRDAFS